MSKWYKDTNNIYLIGMKNGKKGFYKNGKTIIDNKYQSITYSESSNIIVAGTSKNYFFYNLDGKQILDSKYQEYSLAGNYISVLENDERKLYDTNGNYLTNIAYKSIRETENPNYFITVDENNRYSIMNKSTEVKDTYANLKYAFDDYFIFTNDENKMGLLNVWQGIVIEPEYDSILKIENIKALEAKKGNETTIYSKDLKKISTISDLIVENIKEKFAVIYSDTEMIYLDENGNQISNLNIFDKSGNKVLRSPIENVNINDNYSYNLRCCTGILAYRYNLNGDVLELDEESAEVTGRVQVGNVMIDGNGVGDVGVVAFSPEDGIVAARLQSELPVFLRIAQDAEAAAERLDWILKLLNHALNEDFRIGAYTFCPRKKIWLIPVAVIAVLPGHVRWNDHPAFRRIAPFVGAHKIAMLVVHVNLPGPGANLQRFLEILARHGVVHLVEGKGEIRADFHAFPFQILILRIRQRKQSVLFLGLK